MSVVSEPKSRKWSPHPPAPRQWVSAVFAPTVKGEHVVLVWWDGEMRHQVAVSEVYKDKDGHDVVDVLSEGDFHEARLAGRDPSQSELRRAWYADLVWL